MSTRDAVLEALRAGGAGGVSGEHLARELGVSRMAVSKHVAALREAGYAIASHSGVGYVLESAPDAPLPAEVVRHLTSRWERLEGGGETGSTNADAVEFARAGTPHATAVLASSQHAGRGRLGRSWESPRGGVYVSAVLRPTLAPSALAGLPLAIAVGVAEECAALGVPVSVKWPNDVLAADGKLAGVLLEMSAEADRTAWVVVGVGLNVARPADPAHGAAYLADHVSGVGLARAAAAVLDGIAAGYRIFAEEGFSAVRERHRALDALSGAWVCVREVDGTVRAEGQVRGVGDDGRLVVETHAGPVALASGDVTLASPERRTPESPDGTGR